MAVFAVTDTIFTDASLPIVARDPAIDAYTKFCFDVLDPYTWPSQAGAAIGASLIDLAENDNATVSTAALTWNNGLVFGPSSSILLPVSSNLASDVLSFGISVWVKFANLSGTFDSILTHGKSGSGFDNTQYIIYSSGTSLLWAISGQSFTSPFVLSIGRAYQIGITIVKSGLDYIGTLWVDGVAVDSKTVSGPMVSALTKTAARIGFGDIFGASSENLKLLRCNANALTSYSAVQFIADDYAVGQSRF